MVKLKIHKTLTKKNNKNIAIKTKRTECEIPIIILNN